jgi:hypothetical protein
MARAVDPTTSFDYILKADREEDADCVTTWKLRPLTARQLAQIEDGTGSYDPDTGHVAVRQGTVVLETLRSGLAGVDNFLDSGDTAIEFVTENTGKRHGVNVLVPTYAFLDKIHPDDRRELCNAITEQTRLTEADRGN